MRTPPRVVVLVARTHWVVGLTMLAALAVLHPLARKVPFVEFGPRTYWTTAAIAGTYLLAGTLVWLGAPFGRLLSRVCGLLYLARPQLGSLLWQKMDSPEYQAHFARR